MKAKDIPNKSTVRKVTGKKHYYLTNELIITDYKCKNAIDSYAPVEQGSKFLFSDSNYVAMVNGDAELVWIKDVEENQKKGVQQTETLRDLENKEQKTYTYYVSFMVCSLDGQRVASRHTTLSFKLGSIKSIEAMKNYLYTCGYDRNIHLINIISWNEIEN